MNPSEARKLLGGYLTGTLTQDEAKALFEAAIEDQELFEELIRSEPVREVVADPSTRAELLRSLDEPARSRPWWKRRWAAVGGGAAAIACAALVFIVLSHRTEPVAPVQVAQSTTTVREPVPVEQPPETAPARPAPARRKSAVRSEAPAFAPVPAPIQEGRVSGLAGKARADLQNEPNRPGIAAFRTLAPMPMAAADAAQPAIKYTMMRGAEVVGPWSEFHAGDELEVVAETPAGGYLYVFRKDDDGAWTSLAAGTAVSARTPISLPSLRIQAGAKQVEIMLVETSEPNAQLRPDQVQEGSERVRPSAVASFAESAPRPAVVRIPLKVVSGATEPRRP